MLGRPLAARHGLGRGAAREARTRAGPPRGCTPALHARPRHAVVGRCGDPYRSRGARRRARPACGRERVPARPAGADARPCCSPVLLREPNAAANAPLRTSLHQLALRRRKERAMEILILVVGLIILALASLRYGHESRDGFAEVKR